MSAFVKCNLEAITGLYGSLISMASMAPAHNSPTVLYETNA